MLYVWLIFRIQLYYQTCLHNFVKGLDIPGYGPRIVFPQMDISKISVPKCDFSSLDPNTQQLLETIAEQDTYTRYKYF